MSTSPQDPQAGRPQRDQAAIARLVERLARRFPDLPPEEIERLVRATYAEFAGSRIRSFLPTLVERSVRAQLTRPGAG
ncbi:MAG: hypothetical protein ABI775_04845 [Pseudonocardiales bacterium]